MANDRITYYEGHEEKKLNEMVFLGSHDAGITGGGKNAKTQEYNIREQAGFGARFFDIRIAAFNDQFASFDSPVSLSTYHDATKFRVYTTFGKKTLNKDVNGGTRREKGLEIHATLLGDRGIGLPRILQGAKDFVETDEPLEFLMLKFNKSTNWRQIGAMCMEILGESIYKTTNPHRLNLNKCTLDDLGGKVIVLFTEDGYAEIRGQYINEPFELGILKWRNLYKKTSTIGTQTYSPDFVGLQYYGKGGVSAGASGNSGKIDANARIQSDLMKGAGPYEKKGLFSKTNPSLDRGADPNVVGMMYWTTTGASRRGIRVRNDKMWNKQNRQKLVDTTGVAGRLRQATPSTQLLVEATDNALEMQGNSVAPTKVFMPNFIMVDFVDRSKGSLVQMLNSTNQNQINQAIEDYGVNQGNAGNEGNQAEGAVI